MFGITIPPGVDQVRIIALNGKKGKPPCLWEGIPSVEQARIEECIGSDRRVIQWLQRNGMIDNGVPQYQLQQFSEVITNGNTATHKGDRLRQGKQ